MSSSSWLKEEKASGSHFHWWLYRHGDVVHVCDSRTTCWFPTHVTSHGNLRLAVSVLIQPSAAGEDTVHLPAGWTRRGPGATDQEGGGGASLQDDRVTGETSDCCLLCTIIQNTWIIITPEISNGQTEFYVYLNGVNCPFDESSHLCKVTCQFGRACFSPPFLYSPLPVTPPPTPELPFFPFSHVTSCSDTSRPYGAAILGDAYVVLLRKHASCQWSTRFATSQSLGLVLSHSSKNKLESGGRVSPLSSDSQAGPSVWAHQRVKIF